MLQRFNNTEIIVEIPDKEVQGISLKRKAHVQSIMIELTAQRVALNLLIKYYGRNEDDTYADALDLPGIVAYQKSLVADMTTLADASTGVDICGSNEEYLPDATNEGQTILNPLLENKSYMYDFELFAAMMHQPAVVADVATGKILYAASQGQLD